MKNYKNNNYDNTLMMQYKITVITVGSIIIQW